VKAVFMAGGLGTRLRVLAAHLPERLVRRADRWMIERLRLLWRGRDACEPGQARERIVRGRAREGRGDRGARAQRGDEWVATIPDSDRPGLEVVVESADGERARRAVEESRERTAARRKESV